MVVWAASLGQQLSSQLSSRLSSDRGLRRVSAVPADRGRHIRFAFTPNVVSALCWAVRSWASVEQRAYPMSIPATGTLSRLGHRHRALLRAGVMGLSAVSSAGCSRHLRCAAHVPEEVRLTGTSSTAPTRCRGIGNRPTRRFRLARQCRL